MSKSKSPSKDVYTRITDKIIASLEQGVRPWMKPWNAEHAAGRIEKPLRHNGQPYNGINVMMLWAAAADQGYSAPIWMTYRQAKALGAQVRKGESGELVVYANTLVRTAEDEKTGEEIEQAIPFMKGYTVFNVEQIEGLPEAYHQLADPVTDPVERIGHAERFFEATGAEVNHGGNRAYYNITHDRIQMPVFESFRDAESYYATLAHETTHWTRHPSRLGLERDFGRKRFGDEGYAQEELVAELGSAYLCADLGIAPEVREDHSAYIASWLEVLRNDKRAIFTAAAHAQRAVDYLNGMTAKSEKAA
ncbi:ArdC family protein [Chromatocurvus halotolerans]|uniref:Antirestriction protein ArdC n=2 Tax=Chromatocurvus halotolerans TaxID=1132028 RepID=A0A4R2KAZ7_9GAMM|nr:zincin-like metallopeptidase domain-containing protein [Chromatocurvus halotolerans]TCO69372.1 antirestriction protein ArdC [Chromatocurvus halotolerans]